MFNVVMIVPTGVGAEIGGFCGDATPAAKLLAGCCDNLITHPNVVNGADLNEMSENTLYVEGSILDRFLEGRIKLKTPSSQNKILVVGNSPLPTITVNAVSAARATMGINAEILPLNTPLEMTGWIEGDHATGDVYGWEELVEQVKQHQFDALAIHTPIKVDRELQIHYFKNGGINPWGGVEAKASKLIADKLNKPVAHAPVEATKIDDKELYLIQENEILDPRMVSESLSMSYIYCVFKGLNKAPRVSQWDGLSCDDVNCLITPVGCVGKPHKACLKNGIDIIAVKENKTCMNDEMPEEFIFVDNYLEAAGMLMCRRYGIYWKSVRRPLSFTKVLDK